MSVAIVTGCSGLIGSEACRFFHDKGLDIVGIDNDMRSYFFGDSASTRWNQQSLTQELSRYQHHDFDIRDHAAINKLFQSYDTDISCIIHTAAQPSHDWAAKEPLTDFSVNATGTLHLLEAFRQYCPDASFIFTSTNKVYGDTPNRLPLIEQATRWEIDSKHQYAEFGIDESMSIDQSKHSLFGASKAAADLLVQEYGRYFGLKTASFRGGCLTGPAHSGAALHGFLAYLVRCTITGNPYTVFGYKAEQVRDNIHSYDLVNAFWHYYQDPKVGEVYNMGGSRHSNCSMLEAIDQVESLVGQELQYSISEEARLGDHIWYINDVRRFKDHYPGWSYRYDLNEILKEIVEAGLERYKGQ